MSSPAMTRHTSLAEEADVAFWIGREDASRPNLAQLMCGSMDDVASAPRRLPRISGKLLAGLVIASVVAAGLVYRAQSALPSTGVTYLTATVQKGDLSSGVTATGPIAAATAVPLNFKLSGRVAEIDVQIGDRVQPGQVLARLDPT